MHPLNPTQILRILENGYFMTHQEQSEAAQYIRQLQQEVLDEREACAKLCEDLQLTDLAIRDWADGTYDCATAIRARGNHEQN